MPLASVQHTPPLLPCARHHTCPPRSTLAPASNPTFHPLASPAPHPPPRQYHLGISINSTSPASLQIQHHGAFDARLAIVDAVRLRLCACLADSGGGGPPAIACVAISGCLQVIMSVTDPWAGAASVRLASEPQSLVQEIYDSLPAGYRAGQVMVQVGAAACRFAPEGDTQPGQGGQATSVGAQMVTIQSLSVHPACGLQSGLSEEQEAEVQLQGTCASTGLKVVAVACAGGRQVHVEASMAPAETSCRWGVLLGLSCAFALPGHTACPIAADRWNDRLALLLGACQPCVRHAGVAQRAGPTQHAGRAHQALQAHHGMSGGTDGRPHSAANSQLPMHVALLRSATRFRHGRAGDC